ncbi:MAG: Lrp/AsnC family transcriptional regulator [Lutimonas sp.]|jgi:Lrp/AsnC family transcriptional regulator, leucine-responsive regulatory protein
MKYDSIDQEILWILQTDSKTTTKQMAHQLGLSNTAVYERVRKLERTGVIKQYVALVDFEKIDKSFIAFCQIKLVQHRHDLVKKFEKEVLQFDEVLECYNVSGEYDYILRVAVKNMKAYREFLNSKLTMLDYIGSAYSTFIINEVKNSVQIRV